MEETSLQAAIDASVIAARSVTTSLAMRGHHICNLRESRERCRIQLEASPLMVLTCSAIKQMRFYIP